MRIQSVFFFVLLLLGSVIRAEANDLGFDALQRNMQELQKTVQSLQTTVQNQNEVIRRQGIQITELQKSREASSALAAAIKKLASIRR